MERLLNKFLYISILIGLILVCNTFLYFGKMEAFYTDAPYISNQYAFSYELGGKYAPSPEVWIDKWLFEQEAPFKYRLLDRVFIGSTYLLFQNIELKQLDALYISYILWTVVFLFLFLFVAGKLVTMLVISNNASLKIQEDNLFYISVTALALAPPILFGFKFPVHISPNDFIGYILISLSLMSLMQEKYAYFTFWMLLGIFCRETNLIVLAPFMLMSNIHILKRISISVFICAISIAYRLIWTGGYNPLDGAAHNHTYPIEALLFLFLVFAPFWLLGFLGYFTTLKQTENHLTRALNQSFIPVTLLVILIVWYFARIREIRIEFILFFYFIPYSILYGASQFSAWISMFRPVPLIILLMSSIVLSLLTLNQFMPASQMQHLILEQRLAHFYTGFGGGWVMIFIGYFAITLVFIFLSIYSAFTKYKTINASSQP